MGSGFGFENSATALAILAALPSLMQLLVLLVGIVFALARIRRFPRASTLLIVGLALLLVARIAGWIGTIYLSRTVGVGSGGFAIYHGLLSLMSGLMNAGGMVMIILAVFASRDEVVIEQADDDRQDAQQNNDQPDDPANPYSAPASTA